MSASYPTLRQTVLDCRHPRRLAEFYRQLLGYEYRPGDELPAEGPDAFGEDWIVIRPPGGGHALAFQANAEYEPPVWTPEPDRPGERQQMLHLDLTVADDEALERQRVRVLELGGAQLYDRSTDPDEALYVFADPSGHPFCIFVG